MSSPQKRIAHRENRATTHAREVSPRRRALRSNARLVAAWLGTLLLSSTLVWAISWYRPQPPVKLVLVGAGYETNLAVPHNVPGWRSLQALAQYARGEASGVHLSLEHRPVRLHGDFRWDDVIVETDQETLLLCVMAHGAADAEGPYLLADEATGTQDQRLRLTGLWKALATLPEEQQKLVCFDVTSLPADQRLGLLNNGFARQLREQEEAIRSVPNLVVINSTDQNQQSWVNPQQQQSQFGLCLLEGLAGQVTDRNHNGRLDAAELHAELVERLSTWAPAHTGAHQSPLLLPAGEEGQQRARQLELGEVGRKEIAASEPPRLLQSPQREQAWQQYESLMQTEPPPYAYAPAFWREYVDTLLRADELLRAGDSTSAQRLFDGLSTIEYRMLSERDIPLSSQENSLACHTVVGSGALPLEEARHLLDQFSTASEQQLTEIWAKKLETFDEGSQQEARLRLAIFTLLWQQAVDDPARHLDPAESVIVAVRSPLHPLPAELHFLAMLARHLPAEALQGESLALVGQALQLRALAERAAVGCSEGNSYTPQRSLAWIKDRVRQADSQRRFGEDLLFAAAPDRAQAAAYFTRAREGYTEALADSLRVQSAYVTRDRVFALLPYYARWLAEMAADPREEYRVESDRLQQVTRLWEQFHQLGHMLAEPDARWITRAPPPSSSNPDPQSLVQLTKTVELGLVEMQSGHEQFMASMASGEVPADRSSIERMFQVPQANWPLRRRLTARLLEVNTAEEPPATSRSAELAPAKERLMHSRQRALATARWQGKLALAMLGRNLFQAHFTTASETYEQVEHRLDMASVEPRWWESVTTAGTQILDRWEYQPPLLAQAMKQTSVDDPHDTLTAIALADRLIRQFDGAQASRLTDRPDVALRRFELHRLANFLAERSLHDHWYGLDPLGEPYFQQATSSYLSDANRLYPDSPRSEALRDQLAAAGGFEIVNLSPLKLTSQHQLQLHYDLQAASGAGVTPGYPVCWLRSDSGLQLIEPEADQRVVRRLDQEHRHGSLAFTLRSPRLEQAEQAPASQEQVSESAIGLNVFFRGQHLQAETQVRQYLRPEIAMIRHPRPATAALSITASPELHNQFAGGSGAIAFVLDCSGSMGPAQGATSPGNSKYAQATAALKQVLAKLPAGTQISVWTFGEAVGPGRTALAAETTIQCVQPPVSWNPHDASQRSELFRAIDPQRIVPWNESPIVRTILAAKGDLDSAAGFRSMVVITDGMDNRFADDRVANPQGQSIPTALRKAFDGSGVALNVIGFQVVGAEAADVQRQFSVVEKLQPSGRFDYADHAEALAETLSAALHTAPRFELRHSDIQSGDSLPEDRQSGGGNAESFALEVGQTGGGEVWPLQGIMPGAYRVHWGAEPAVKANLLLEPGDCLSLSLANATAGLHLQQEPYAARAYRQRPTANSRSWQATSLQNQAGANESYRAAIGLERKATVSGDPFHQLAPTALWFELEGKLAGSSPAAISWRPLRGYPLPVWNLNAANWPQASEGHAPAQPRIRMWWTTQPTLPFAATVKRTPADAPLSELAGTAIHAADEPVRVEAVEVQEQYVEVAPGRRERRSCLVVRLSHSPGKVYWAEPLGLQTAGAESRFYPSIGSYTGLFWPVTPAEAERVVKGIGLVSLQAFQQEAERQGNYLPFDQLPTPDPGDTMPTPAVLFP